MWYSTTCAKHVKLGSMGHHAPSRKILKIYALKWHVEAVFVTANACYVMINAIPCSCLTGTQFEK